MDLVRDFQRGAVQLHVLHHAERGSVAGVWLMEELARHGYHVGPGTLYPMLHRLEAAGLIAGHDTVVEGMRMRHYGITIEGSRALEQARQAVRELANELLER